MYEDHRLNNSSGLLLQFETAMRSRCLCLCPTQRDHSLRLLLINHEMVNGKKKRKKKKHIFTYCIAELMLLGFISLLLAVAPQPISRICVSDKVGTSLLPCRKDYLDKNGKDSGGASRRLLLDWSGESMLPWRRVLAGTNDDDYCYRHEKKLPLISESGVHQLHIFIFVLAVFHVLYSVITMCLAQAKMKRWKAWEKETASLEYQFSNDPSRLRFTTQTSFVRRHGGFTGFPILKWVVAFFRQFTGSVTKVDYMTLRHGFINAHMSRNSNFNFQKYIKRSLEDDFKVVVGISLPLWILAIATMLLNVYGTHFLYWLSFLPLVILLVVGTKLELVITKMAHQIQDRSVIVSGTPLVQPSNELFWFGHPEWILTLIHLTIFENAFQISHFLWTWFSFGLKSCFHVSLAFTIVRIMMGILLQFMCSYITFPLYALVTQMGSNHKKAIFEDQVAHAIKRWCQRAKERRKQREMENGIPLRFISPQSTPSQGTSPVPLLQRHRSIGVGVVSADSHTIPHRSNSDSSIATEESHSFVLRARREEYLEMGNREEDREISGQDYSFT